MNITASYPGGNIRVLSVEGDTVKLAPDLRTTTEDWFYTAPFLSISLFRSGLVILL